MEVTHIEVTFAGATEEYELSPGEDLADMLTRFSDLFLRSREKNLKFSVSREKVKGVVNGN